MGAVLWDTSDLWLKAELWNHNVYDRGESGSQRAAVDSLTGVFPRLLQHGPACMQAEI
jgi:hypothetical protein